MLSEQSVSYLEYLEEEGMSPSTLKDKRRVLKRFVFFVEERDERDVFTETFLEQFQAAYGRTNVKKAVRPFSRHLYRKGLIDTAMGHYHRKLPEPFSSYLSYVVDLYHNNPWPHRIVLTAFWEYLSKRGLTLEEITIDRLDRFMAGAYDHLTVETRNKYRSCLRGFLKHLFMTGLIRKNLAFFLRNKRVFERNLPPRHLTREEIRLLFDRMRFDTERDLRANAMIYLGFTLGLRPKEVSLMTIDDIGFCAGELSLPYRKNNQPAVVSLSEEALKALTAYVLYARPKGAERAVFLHLKDDRPLSANRVSKEIGACMRRAGLSKSAYCLRHTFAHQLLEQGRSVFDIKEMMGHQALKSTQRYLRIHTTLMRRVLFDETV